MPQVVDAHTSEPTVANNCRERLADLLGRERIPVRTSEDEVVVGIAVTQRRPVLGLVKLMSQEYADATVTEVDPAGLTRCRFGAPKITPR